MDGQADLTSLRAPGSIKVEGKLRATRMLQCAARALCCLLALVLRAVVAVHAVLPSQCTLTNARVPAGLQARSAHLHVGIAVATLQLYAAATGGREPHSALRPLPLPL